MTRLLLASALAVLLAGPSAHADPSADDKARAKSFYDEGTKRYDLREYEAAIDAFRKAYDLLPDPLFLFDIGQSYRQLKDCDNARSFYKSYLRNKPDADNRDKVEKFITDMDDCVRAQDAARPAPPPSPPPSSPTEPAAQPLPPAPAAAETSSGSSLRTLGIVTGIAGVALIGGGVYFSIDAADKASQVTDACASGCNAADVLDLDQQGHDASVNAWILYGVGGAAVAAGVYMFVLGSHDEAAPPITVTPQPGGATVHALVRF